MNTTTIAAVIRHALTFFGGVLVTKGIELDPTSIEAISGGVATIVGIAWSVWQKKKTAAS